MPEDPTPSAPPPPVPPVVPKQARGMEGAFVLLVQTDGGLARKKGGEAVLDTNRTNLGARLKSITQRRMTIQFAANAQWPWHDPASGGVRKEFHLPAGQPFTG